MRSGHGWIRRLAVVATLGLGAPLLAMTASPAGATPRGGPPRGLQPTLVNVHPTLDRSLYGAQIAVNPRNPNNIVVAAVSDTGYTQACVASGDPNCKLVPTSFGLLEPMGNFEPTLGFTLRGLFVSFNRGRTFKQIDLSDFSPVGRPELYSQNEGGLNVGPNGTFYLSMNTLDWGSPTNFAPSAGVAVSKSTDGGRTWSQPVLVGTPGDFPYLTVDEDTGTIYSLSGDSPLCSRQSCQDPSTPPQTSFSDAFVAASRDGVHWTQPQRAGGTDGVNQYDGSGSKDIAAAFGRVATTFVVPRSTTNPAQSDQACEFFVGGVSPCTVFQTSRNAGATWSRHRVPLTATAPTGINNTLVAADPSKPGHYTAAVLNNSQTAFSVFQTRDSGNTWSPPTTVANDGKTHWNPYLAYSPQGVLGLVWRTNEGCGLPGRHPVQHLGSHILRRRSHLQPAARGQLLFAGGPARRLHRWEHPPGSFGYRPRQAGRLRRLGRLANGRKEHLLQRHQIPGLQALTRFAGASGGLV
jgi:hypothetical protein